MKHTLSSRYGTASTTIGRARGKASNMFDKQRAAVSI